MPLRLLDYMTRIWLRHSEQHGLPLPPVIPFVLHQGPGAWTVSTAFADMIAFPPGLEAHLTPHVPHFSHALLDLTQCEPATLSVRGSLAIAGACLCWRWIREHYRHWTRPD